MSKTDRILMLSDNPGEDYLARIHTGASRAAREAGWEVDQVNLYRQSTTPRDYLTTAQQKFVLLTPPLSDDRSILALLEQQGKAFVRIAPLLDLERGDTVAIDEFEAAAAITGVLTARGHKRIAIMRGPKNQLVSMRRYNGYANAIGALGQAVDPALTAEGDFTRESGKEQAAKLFAAKPTAIFACNDDMAAGIIDAAKRASLNVPDDLSIVGYDDNTIASKIQPRLTTVRQP